MFWWRFVADAALEIDAATVFFPVAEAGGIQRLVGLGRGGAVWCNNRLLFPGFICRGRTFAYHLGRGNHIHMLSPAPMSFKTNRATGPFPRLSGLSLLGFSGVEAASFLQAQTMNDVRSLAIGNWQWNGWLNAKGRVICLCALLRRSEDEFIAVLLDYPADELQLLLQRFVFRTKVRMQCITDLVPAADLAPDERELARHQAEGDRESGWRLDFSGNAVRRHLLLLPETSPGLSAESPEASTSWWNADLAHGLPRLGPDQREAWTPQMLSLDRLHAFSLRKGCYPGQEIVARTHYLGQARRGLTRVTGEGLKPGAALTDEHGGAFGSIICIAPDARHALAVVQLDKQLPTAWIGDQSVALPEFLDGLQRPM